MSGHATAYTALGLAGAAEAETKGTITPCLVRVKGFGIMAIFDLVWKRDQPLPDVFQTEIIPQKLRSQVLWLWKDTLKKFDFDDEGWAERQNIHLKQLWEAVCREHGVQNLCNSPFRRPEDDIEQALLGGGDTTVALSIIELSMRLICFLSGKKLPQEVVAKTISELNHRFRENGVGYQGQRALWVALAE